MEGLAQSWSPEGKLSPRIGRAAWDALAGGRRSISGNHQS